MNEIPHDQEIVHIAHPLDRGKLVLQPFPRLVLRPGVRIQPPDTFRAQPAEHTVRHLALRHRVMRQPRHAELKRHVAPVRDLPRPVHRVRHLPEDGAHLLLALDVELLGLHAHPLLVRQRLARLDAHQHFLRRCVLFLKVVAVVCRDQRDVHLPRQGDQPREHGLLVPQVMIHDLDIEVFLAEDVLHLPHVGAGTLVLAVHQQLRQVAAQAGAQADQALVMFPDQVVIDPRPVVITCQETLADQVHQVLVTRIVLAQQDQVAVLPAGQALVRPVLADVRLAADDRLDPRLRHRGIEINRAVQYAVVGDRARIHAELLQPFYQRGNPARAVQQAVLRMQMQMRKAHSVSPGGVCRLHSFPL